MISSRAKSSKNCLLLASNTSPNLSMPPSISDTSPTNGKLPKSFSFWNLASLPTSYRLIILLLILSKVFERLIFYRLLPIIENQLILPDHQSGFRQRHSTTHQTHRIVNKIQQLNTSNIALQPFSIYHRHLTKSGTLVSYSNCGNFSPLIISYSSNLT
jgi:hypothetical protein